MDTKKSFFKKMFDKVLSLSYSLKESREQGKIKNKEEYLMRRFKLKPEAILAIQNGMAFETTDFIFYVKELVRFGRTQFQVFSYSVETSLTDEVNHEIIEDLHKAINLAFALSTNYDECDLVTNKVVNL